MEWLGLWPASFQGSPASFCPSFRLPWPLPHTSVDVDSCLPRSSGPWNRHCPFLPAQPVLFAHPGPGAHTVSFPGPVPHTGPWKVQIGCHPTPCEDTCPLLTPWPIQEWLQLPLQHPRPQLRRGQLFLAPACSLLLISRPCDPGNALLPRATTPRLESLFLAPPRRRPAASAASLWRWGLHKAAWRSPAPSEPAAARD